VRAVARRGMSVDGSALGGSKQVAIEAQEVVAAAGERAQVLAPCDGVGLGESLPAGDEVGDQLGHPSAVGVLVAAHVDDRHNLT
jgi:hypothetical protein